MKHPTEEQVVELWKETRRNSRRAINRCTKSVTRYEWHLCQIEEAEEFLLQCGKIRESECWGKET